MRKYTEADVQAARDEGFSNAICFVLGYLNGTGHWGSMAYEEILKEADREKIIKYARKNGELGLTGLGRYLSRERRLQGGRDDG